MTEFSDYMNTKDKHFIIKLWELMNPFHRHLYGILAVTLFYEVIRNGGPYLFSRLIDVLKSSGGAISLDTVFVVIGALAILRILAVSIDYALDIVIAQVLWRAEQYISTSSFSKMLELSMDYHEQENTGTKIGIVNKGTDKLIELVGAFTWEFQPIVLQIIVSVSMIFLMSWKIGILFSLSILPFLFITFKMFQSTRHLRVSRFDAYETSSGEIGDTISNITVVQAFAQEKREHTAFQGLWHYIRSLSEQEFKRHTIIGYGRSLLSEFFVIVLLIFSLFEIKNGHMTVGSLVFLMNLVERAYSNVYRLGRIYNRAADAAEPVDRISNLLSRESSIRNAPDAYDIGEIEGQITFDHVSFAYTKNIHAKKVLNDVSFTIPAGSFTALVGKSGSGKSTVAKLLSRYYDPTTGNIIIDGKHDLKKVDIDSYRSQTAVVFQDSPVPSRKVWEVISYAAGKNDYSEVKSRVLKAAKLAHAHEFIMQFEEGYETEVGERGVKLSGGQRQRLAIARALFAEPKILVMDEPTSHLDTLSEKLIQDALEEISRKRSFTKIVIAHRLSTVQHADQILVMEKGKLVEAGTHKELLAKNGVYAQIVRQSELISS